MVSGAGTYPITQGGVYVLSPYIPAKTTFFYVSTTGSGVQNCNAGATSSFTLVTGTGNSSTPNIPEAAPLSSMYANNGIHGDTFFVSFGGAGSVPEIMGGYVQKYNTQLYPANSTGTTGAITFNTTPGTSLKGASLDNCTPSCGSGGAGHTLNVTSVSAGGYPTSGGVIQVGMTIPGSGFASTAFASAGTLITGSGTSGATCDNGPCTGTGTTGTYLVGGAAQTVHSFSGSLELSAVTITNFNIANNTVVTNTTTLFGSGIAAAAVIVGDNHSINLTNMNISTNYIDPSGTSFCMDPLYANSPVGSISGNVNLLGNGNGQWDTGSNAVVCHGTVQ